MTKINFLFTTQADENTPPCCLIWLVLTKLLPSSLISLTVKSKPALKTNSMRSAASLQAITLLAYSSSVFILIITTLALQYSPGRFARGLKPRNFGRQRVFFILYRKLYRSQSSGEAAQKILSLYKGEYLADFEALWAISKRIRYSEAYEAALSFW